MDDGECSEDRRDLCESVDLSKVRIGDLKRTVVVESENETHVAYRLLGVRLSSAYASADIFCMPSDSETLGFVVIEAMASGLAVVAADAGGIPSIVKNNSNGLLVPPANPELFANAVRKVLGDTILQDRLKRNKLKKRHAAFFLSFLHNGVSSSFSERRKIKCKGGLQSCRQGALGRGGLGMARGGVSFF